MNKLDVHKILEIDYWVNHITPLSDKGFYSNLRKGLKHVYNHINKYKVEETAYSFLFVRSLDRSSYDDLWSSIIDTCDYPKVELNFTARGKYEKGSLEVINYPKRLGQLKTISVFIRYISCFFLLKKERDLTRAFAMYIDFLVLAVEVEKISKLNFEHLVLFADMQRLDNFLSQFFRGKKTTITLQHGLYIEYKLKPNLNIVNYKNVVSDYFLSWGRETKELIQKYNSKCKVVVCGHPNNYDTEVNSQSDFFTVLLDQRIFHDYNQQMLNIAFELAQLENLKVNVRTHPKDAIEEYEINSKVVIEGGFKASKFAIGHTSTMMFEMMAYGIPIYKFKSDVPVNEINDKLVFGTASELKEIRSIDIDFKKESEFYLEYTGDESKMKYREFFDVIVKKK